jgi:hypothetical protein
VPVTFTNAFAFFHSPPTLIRIPPTATFPLCSVADAS